MVLGTAALLWTPAGGAAAASGWALIGWNDLGMHCMDADYSVFAILPPYNTIHAQLIDTSGRLVTNPGGITVTYQAVHDSSDSINSTSVGKTNFWDFVAALFGGSPPVDEGLAGFAMPGSGNQPQAMAWHADHQWFTAEGVPITPSDDAGWTNYYPMMRLVARDGAGSVLATTDIVLPVSDEMDCSACHGSGGAPAARPIDGWVNDPDPVLDYRRNILRLHDDHRAVSSAFQAAAAQVGYDTQGLEATVAGGSSILCAACHASNALAGTGVAGLPPLTRSVHAYHASVHDPEFGGALGDSDNRSACYRCHPGSATRCLRGAMGRAVGSDGEYAMQCQSCHGDMARVGANGRIGWLDQPACQSCHTGTAALNSGLIRFNSAFDGGGSWRQPADDTFATNSDTPSAGFWLYRFSVGHGGLQCEACHGSTHAEIPSSHVNDNVQAQQLQGHVGPLAECTSCHGSAPSTVDGGPHGLHPLGQGWANEHHDEIGGDRKATVASCQACHGTDYRGTVLSRSQADRTISTEHYGSKHFWRGYQIGCYTCHDGPNSESPNANRAPVVVDTTATATAEVAVAVPLTATDADGDSLALRVVSQPAAGVAWMVGGTAWYRAFPDFAGSDSFSFAAWDGMADSNLGHVTLTVAGSACTLECSVSAPANAPAGALVSFVATVTASGCTGEPALSWQFGDDATGHGAQVSHAYSFPGSYDWSLSATADSASCSSSGTISVGPGGGAAWSAVLVASHAPGAEGSVWRTDVVLLNPGGAPVDVTLRYLDGSQTTTAAVNLAGGETVRYGDVLVSLLHLDGTTTGALHIDASGELVVVSRTYNLSPMGGYGQYFPAVQPAQTLEQGQLGALAGVAGDADYRTNIGFLNPSQLDASVRVVVYGADGSPLGTLQRWVPAGEWRQVNDVIAEIGQGATPVAWATVEVLTGGVRVWAYASVVSRATGDPITVPVAIVSQ
jgi:PKD repeat protein